MNTGVSVVYYGWPGHFICADRCRFRLNTLVSRGDVRVVVSTVGNMLSLDDESKIERIGAYRYGETMTFYAHSYEECGHVYWDADISRGELSYFRAYNEPNDWEYQAGHEAVVAEVVTAITNGELT